jgi:hypothetical protein
VDKAKRKVKVKRRPYIEIRKCIIHMCLCRELGLFDTTAPSERFDMSGLFQISEDVIRLVQVPEQHEETWMHCRNFRKILLHI